MKTHVSLAGVILAFAAFVLPSIASARDIPGQWIAVFEDEEQNPHGRSEEIARETGAERGAVWSHAIKGFSFRGSEQAAAAVAKRRGVRRVEPDREVEAYCHTGAQEVPAGIARVGATANSTADVDQTDDKKVAATIAIVDTGIYAHGDLNEEAGKHWDCASYNGCVSLSSPKDDNGHGTHVAGTAAAIDNGRSVVGVAPGARLWSIRVLGPNGSGAWSWVINGLNVAAANAASIDAVNMSLGGASSESDSSCAASSFHQAICGVTSKGVPVVVSAGNSAADSTGYVPAKYDEVITVSALDGADALASFSNFGADVDLAAPGVSVLSTWPGTRKIKWGQCATLNGTSMASPHVTGAVALYVASHGRDCNRDGQRNGGDVSCIRDYLIASGQCPGGQDPLGGVCPTAWSSDVDGVNEPLLSVAPPF